MRGINFLKRLARKTRRLFVPGAVILTYHRVVDLSSDPCGLAVSPRHFAQHIDRIRRTCNVVRLHELTEALNEGALPPRTVAVTFDDGYSDVLEHAYPILQAAAVPATVFVPAAAVSTEREFWWDELEYLLFAPHKLPGHLDLLVQREPLHWDVEDRCAVFWGIHRLLKPLSDQARNSVLDELAAWSGVKPPCRDDHRPLQTSELSSLTRTGLIEIGAHTVSHAALSSLCDEEQSREIVGGRAYLSSLLDAPVRSFAFPYGEVGDFTDRTVAILRETGFDAGCTMIKGCVEVGADPLCLTRYMVQDWPADVFARRLESFFIS